MRPSTELEAVFRRVMTQLRTGDEESTPNLISKTNHVRMILTGYDEWFLGHDEVLGMLLVRFKESGITRFEFEHVEALESGSVGWVAAKVLNYRENGEAFRLRHTGIFVLEAGTWRIAQWHVSNPAPNIEVFGHEMPKSLGDLVASYEAEQRGLTDITNSGTVTVMFTDLVDSTKVSERVGDQQWTEIIAQHFDMVRQAVERVDGTMVKTLGDGTMAAFGSATAAIQSAIAIQESMTDSELKVRIGLHSGDSQRKDSDYYGVAVNKAARVSSVAKAGQILASAVTAELAGGHSIDFGESRTVTLKGLSGSHVILPVLWS